MTLAIKLQDPLYILLFCTWCCWFDLTLLALLAFTGLSFSGTFVFGAPLFSPCVVLEPGFGAVVVGASMWLEDRLEIGSLWQCVNVLGPRTSSDHQPLFAFTRPPTVSLVGSWPVPHTHRHCDTQSTALARREQMKQETFTPSNFGAGVGH